MPTTNYFGEEARKALLEGSAALALAVGKSMGPHGRNTVMDYTPGYPSTPQSTRDGVTIARNFYVNGPADAGNRMVRAASEKAVQDAGDGTSAAVVLAHALFSAGLEALGSRSVVDVVGEIKRDTEFACQEVDKVKTKVHGDMMNHIATIAVNNDAVLGGLIVEAMRQAGASGIVAVEDSPDSNTTMEKQEGMQFQQGYISPLFVNNEARQIVEFLNPVIILLDRPLTSVQGMKDMLESIAKSANPLLILADDVTGEALATFVANKLRGGLSVCCVKLPTNLGHKKDLLQDIAAITGGQAILQELGLDVASMKPAHLGRCAKAVITSTTTRLVGGFGKQEAIQKRIEEINGLLKQNPTNLERERLTERLAKLTGGITILRLGAQTGLELGDKKARCEDACFATRCALEDGVVPGGGFTLARIAEQLEEGIVRQALKRPMFQILENAGRTLPWQQTELPGGANEGYNSLTGEWGDLIEMGVIDPAKVVKSSLRNASSVACQMLLTELVVQHEPTLNTR